MCFVLVLKFPLCGFSVKFIHYNVRLDGVSGAGGERSLCINRCNYSAGPDSDSGGVSAHSAVEESICPLLVCFNAFPSHVMMQRFDRKAFKLGCVVSDWIYGGFFCLD